MGLYSILLHVHKGFGYLILLLVAVFFVALLLCMFGYSGKISKLLRKSTLFTMIFFHLQFLFGLFLLFTSPAVRAAMASGTLMSDGASRHMYVEHPASMLIAAALMTLVNRYIKTHDTLTLKIVAMGTIAVALFAFAFPWTRVFG